jgi:hypothetical protein
MKIAFDIELMRPACPMLQAAFQCDVALADVFPEELWLTSPTKELRPYLIAHRNQLDLLLERTKLFHTKKEAASEKPNRVRS